MNGHNVHPDSTAFESPLIKSRYLSMASNKGLTLKDYNWINSKCRSIAKLEAHGVTDKFIRNELYVLGVFAFRQFHKAGMLEDMLHPSLTYQPQPKELEAV